MLTTSGITGIFLSQFSYLMRRFVKNPNHNRRPSKVPGTVRIFVAEMRHSEQWTQDLDPEIARSALQTFHVNFLLDPELEPDPKLVPDPQCPTMPDPGPH